MIKGVWLIAVYELNEKIFQAVRPLSLLLQDERGIIKHLNQDNFKNIFLLHYYPL